MADVRVTQQSVEVAGKKAASNVQAIAQNIEVVGTLPQPNVQAIAQNIEVVGTETPPGLQVSQITVTAAGTKASSAKVSRVYLEVLATLLDFSVEQTLELSHDAHLTEVKGLATSTLSLGQSADYTHWTGWLSTGNTLSLAQSDFVDFIPHPAGVGTLSLDQDADYEYVPGQHGVTTLALSQEADFSRVRSREASSALGLGDLGHYVGPKWVDAISSVLLSHVGYVPQVYDISAGSQLTFNQDTALGGTKRIGAANQIAFSQYADNIIKIRDAENALELSQSASADKIIVVVSTLELSQHVKLGAINLWAENTLNLTHLPRFNPGTIGPGGPQNGYEHDLPPTHIELTQSAWANIRNASAETTISLGQSNHVLKPIRVSAESNLTQTEITADPETGEIVEVDVALRDSAEVNYTQSYSASQSLQTTQYAHVVNIRVDGIDVAATSTLSLNQEARLSLTADASSQINLGQLVGGGAGRPVDTELELEQFATYLIDRGLTAGNTLAIHQAAAYTLVQGCTLYRYSPFVGSSTDPDAPEPPPESLQEPLAGVEVPFQLVYPAAGAPTDSLTLKTPNLGNIDRLSFNRVQRESRGGTLVIFADPDWPKTQTLVLQFSGLKQEEAQGLLTFIEAHLGQEVGMLDWEHRFWKGVIITPDDPVVEDARNAYSANFEFQGELDPAWTP